MVAHSGDVMNCQGHSITILIVEDGCRAMDAPSFLEGWKPLPHITTIAHLQRVQEVLANTVVIVSFTSRCFKAMRC